MSHSKQTEYDRKGIQGGTILGAMTSQNRGSFETAEDVDIPKIPFKLQKGFPFEFLN